MDQQKKCWENFKNPKRFRFSSLDIKEEDFLSPGYVIQLGQPPGRIDLLTSVTGLEFEECYKSKQLISIHGLEINFIDLENFKKNKHM